MERSLYFSIRNTDLSKQVRLPRGLFAHSKLGLAIEVLINTSLSFPLYEQRDRLKLHISIKIKVLRSSSYFREKKKKHYPRKNSPLKLPIAPKRNQGCFRSLKLVIPGLISLQILDISIGKTIYDY